MILARDLSLQRVLATDERSGHCGRGSLCAEGKKTSQGLPSAACYPQALTMKPIQVLKDKRPFVMPPAAW